jgi:vitamin B12 transporter
MKQYLITGVTMLAAAAALGQTTNNTVVVSATRIDTPIEQVGSSISVISAAEIKQQNAQNAQDAIRLVQGVQSTMNGGPGTSSSVFIRGAESDHTLVLINGIRVNSNTAGGFDLSALPVDMIDQIEVLRGPQSGLYGSDALGGVINITTKKGATVPFGSTASIALGEMGYRTANLGLFGGNKIIDFNVSASFLELENHDIAKNNGGTEDDPYERKSLYGNLGINLPEEGRIDLTTLYNQDENELDAFGGVDDPLENSSKEKVFTSAAVSQPIGDHYVQNVSAGYSWQEYTGINGGSPAEYVSENTDASIKGDWTPVENNTLSVGYDYRHTSAENVGNFPKESRDQHALFINNMWSMKERLFINLGARYDDFSDIDGEATWKASASWFVLDYTRLHGAMGTGYRAPTMNDIYYTFGAPPRTYLKPEQSRSFDIGIEQTLFEESLVADITYFQSDIDDLIAWDEVPPGSGNWQPANVAEAEIRGFEASLAYAVTEAISTRLYYTYTDAEDVQTGNKLARRAEHTGGLTTSWQYSKRGNIYADVTYTGERYDNAANTRELDEFFLVGLGTRYEILDGAVIFAHISNLLDEEYDTAGGYSGVGRIASAGVELSF